MGDKGKWEKRDGILLLALSAGLLGVSAFLCAGRDLWYDELFTMGLANRPLGGLISITAQDVHPPLYYMIVKFFLTVFGGLGIEQAAIAKLVSVLPFFLCLIYALTKVRRFFGMLSAGLFSFLILTMPQLADYTVEVRMYGWALFFVTAGMLHAYELVCAKEKSAGILPNALLAAVSQEKFAAGRREDKKNNWNWCIMTALLLAACYTHYFACVAACLVYVYLLLALWMERRLKKEGKAFFLSCLFCGGGYLPWLLLVVTRQVGQVKDSYWIQPLSWRSLGGCVKFLFLPFFTHKTLNIILAVLLFLCYAAFFVWFVFQGTKKRKEEPEKGRKAFFLIGCVGTLAGLVAFGFLASFLIRPIFVYRYMLPALGVFWLGFAVAVSDCFDKKYVVLPVLAFLLVIGLRNYRSFYGEEMWKKIQMDGAEEIFSRIGEDDIVVCNFDQVQAMAAYYLSNDSYLWYGQPEPLIREMYPECHGLVEGDFSDEAGIRALKKLLDEGKPVCFLGSGNARDEIIEKWENAGIGAEEMESAMVERYWFNLYEIFKKNE